MIDSRYRHLKKIWIKSKGAGLSCHVTKPQFSLS